MEGQGQKRKCSWITFKDTPHGLWSCAGFSRYIHFCTDETLIYPNILKSLSIDTTSDTI